MFTPVALFSTDPGTPGLFGLNDRGFFTIGAYVGFLDIHEERYIDLEFTSADTMVIYSWGYSNDPTADGLTTPPIPMPGTLAVFGVAGTCVTRRRWADGGLGRGL
ncbi:MAG: hypothetical protein AAGI30_07220 [Planctomycetota bacterium]